MKTPQTLDDIDRVRAQGADLWASELSIEVAARVWWDEECVGIEPDARIERAFARTLKAWLLDLAREHRNCEFYRGLVVMVGEMFGAEAKTSDDGSLQDSVLALKVPELVQAAVTERGNHLSWAVNQWEAEVKNRPLVNIHHRTLDDCWRQVMRRFGGDPDTLVGPSHDALVAKGNRHENS